LSVRKAITESQDPSAFKTNPKRFPAGQYLGANTSQAPAAQIDFDAAIHIFRAFIRDMMGSSELHKDKLLRKPIGINDVLEAIRSFPESRLDDAAPTGITVRELLECVSHFSRCDSVKEAVREKLNH